MDLVVLDQLYSRIKEIERKDEAWQMWLAHFHYMIAGQIEFQSFNDYYNRMTGGDIDLRPDAEILAEVEQIREEMKER